MQMIVNEKCDIQYSYIIFVHWILNKLFKNQHFSNFSVWLFPANKVTSFLMLALLLSIIAYEFSKFSPSPDDTVIIDHGDTFEILSENIARPKNIKGITDFNLSSGYQPLENYCWPGHKGTLNDTFYSAESRELNNRYRTSSTLTQDDLFRHPTADLQKEQHSKY